MKICVGCKSIVKILIMLFKQQLLFKQHNQIVPYFWLFGILLLPSTLLYLIKKMIILYWRCEAFYFFENRRCEAIIKKKNPINYFESLRLQSRILQFQTGINLSTTQ